MSISFPSHGEPGSDRTSWMHRAGIVDYGYSIWNQKPLLAPITHKGNVVNAANPQSEIKNKLLTDEDTAPWFNSFSGSDVSVYLVIDRSDIKRGDRGRRNFQPIRELQTLSVSSARSVHPVRRLGESHVAEYTRGGRTIAGSMVCVTGDQDVFAKAGQKSNRERASSEPFFTDELPLFNILIVAANEYGQVAHAALTDITLTNFGITFSEADLYLESTYTYAARYYHPLLPDPEFLNNIDYDGGTNKLSNKVAFQPHNIRSALANFDAASRITSIPAFRLNVLPAYDKWIENQK